ncbi:MAG: sulfite exporter TauE/SafE family protein [Oceanipulchritudo sp.]
MLFDPASSALLLTALVIGITHTLLGPDHYLPFVAIGKARQWKMRRLLTVTFLCGLGHVAGSVILGAIGLAAGWSLGGLESIESVRGEIAAWLLTALGVVYLAWAIKHLGRNRQHTHWHAHADGTVHEHEHTHHGAHAHPHIDANSAKKSTTAWSLFIIFVFGPCEAFIPLLLFPAFQQNGPLAVATTLVFAAATIGTMMGTVYLLSKGLELVFLKPVARYGHIAAGLTILACGTAIHLGL